MGDCSVYSSCNLGTVAGLGKQYKLIRLLRRLNERMRFLKYGPGQYFQRNFTSLGYTQFSSFPYALRPFAYKFVLAHFDGCFSTLNIRPHEPEQRTFLTLQVYLRSSNDLEGGATRFFPHSGRDGSEFYDVEAVPGRVLIFQHEGFIHSGAEVIRGEKIALRSDILYRQIQ